MEFKNDVSYGQIRFSHTDRNQFIEREMHTYHELLYCIGGDVSVYTDGFYRSVKRGTLLLIPRGCYHLFQIHGDAHFERLWVGFSERDLPSDVIKAEWNSVRLIEAPSATVRFLLQMLCEAVDALAAVKAYGILITLLCTLPADTAAPTERAEERRLIRACLSAVEANLCGKLTLSQLAAQLYVSPSTLSHLFKKEMGIPLYRYITQKRLMLACDQIERGAPPSAVFAACGFTEYSSFYRAYVKMFGHSPRAEN